MTGVLRHAEDESISATGFSGGADIVTENIISTPGLNPAQSNSAQMCGELDCEITPQPAFTMAFLSHRKPELDQSNLSPVQLSSNFLSSYLDLFPFHVDISAHKRHKLNWPNWALSTFLNSHLSWASPLSALNLISLLFSSSRIQPCTLHRSVLSSAPPPPSSSTSSFSRWTSSTSSS